jgi:glutamate N-acetyltransferase/amino-acid N-acetyltransferase
MIAQDFRYSAVEAGVGNPGRLDLGLICSEGDDAVAGVFTRNRVVAAPVQVCRERVSTETTRAVLVNSGNSNACTGERGIADALRLSARVAEIMEMAPGWVLPCSTRDIGLPLPVERMEAAIPALHRHRRRAGGGNRRRAGG